MDILWSIFIGPGVKVCTYDVKAYSYHCDFSNLFGLLSSNINSRLQLENAEKKKIRVYMCGRIESEGSRVVET